ncbi:hypothetical protein BT96DRAFT_414077 [Gymnopus androsaceus JB14]|uniref:Uncharacterized protein n=1 Tax=Gymnopus androsaceus JB14 TaxID=1447944 RepID=A0A6A4GUC9_9AGAR|nr:hypothetical protein BT96DRAFT_414077 [Gymnopus androsaceus JB14]
MRRCSILQLFQGQPLYERALRLNLSHGEASLPNKRRLGTFIGRETRKKVHGNYSPRNSPRSTYTPPSLRFDLRSPRPLYSRWRLYHSTDASRPKNTVKDKSSDSPVHSNKPRFLLPLPFRVSRKSRRFPVARVLHKSQFGFAVPLGVVNNRERLLNGIRISLSSMYGKRFQVRISGGAVYDVSARVDQLDMAIIDTRIPDGVKPKDRPVGVSKGILLQPYVENFA